MNRGTFLTCLLGIVMLWWIWNPLDVQAEIASDNAFEGVTWEKIIEDEIEGPYGVVQSMCATEDYIICVENYADSANDPDIVKAYYRNNTDADGNPVEKYSLAKRVAMTNYEHANGMAYNPNTGEIAVALYTNLHQENRGCIFLMDAETLEYKDKIQITDQYNILGIDYDEENDRYIIQTNVEGGYSFKILDSQFQVIEDLGEYAGTAKGSNFQDLCVSGDYIINLPLTLGMGIGDYINMYSISGRTLVSESQLNFNFENVTSDEPESVCELEPGVFAVVVNVVYSDGRRNACVYKTMVPYNFTAAEVEAKGQDGGSDTDHAKDAADSEKNSGASEDADPGEEKLSKAEKEQAAAAENAAARAEQPKKSGQASAGKSVLRTLFKTVFVLILCLSGGLLVYMRIVAVRRERKRKLERARRERARIREMYEN